ncbi:MAG: hypothetical protein BKP49_02485 [Treponema sp. CETP13]|nr:MAG: hypothetical protein BKP49_02485 [Treponema sp. CETP13]
MRTRKTFSEKENSSFDLSISDLMAALCGIFALIMIVVIVQLNLSKSEYVSKNKKAEEYYSMQNNLYKELTEEFKDDLEKWNAEITPDLTIRFTDSEVLFEPDKAILKNSFKTILSNFFPRLITVLKQDDYKNEIEEIRIEGHTATNERMSKNQDYTTGMVLSQERTTNVMLYSLNALSENREWVQKNIAAIGYSNSRPVIIDNKINSKASRRVEFKIKTKAEKVVEDLATKDF